MNCTHGSNHFCLHCHFPFKQTSKDLLKHTSRVMLNTLIEQIIDDLTRNLPENTTNSNTELVDAVIRTLKIKAFL